MKSEYCGNNLFLNPTYVNCPMWSLRPYYSLFTIQTELLAGPTLPHDCIDGSINQSLLNGQEAILVGCKESPEKIYKLKWNNIATLEWVLLKQKLKYPRSNAVAMFIPDILTHCKILNNL